MKLDNWPEDWSDSTKRRDQIKLLGNVHLLDMTKFEINDLLKQIEQVTLDFQRVYKILTLHREYQTDNICRLLQYFPLNDYEKFDNDKINLLSDIAEKVALQCGAGDELSKILRYAIPICENNNFNLNSQVERLLKTCQEILKFSNENYDGSGYPNQVSHEKIPLSARIATVLYGFYAFISPHPFGFELNMEEALLRMRENEGKRYDPMILDSLESLIRLK